MSSTFQHTFQHLVAANDVLNAPPPLQPAPGLRPPLQSAPRASLLQFQLHLSPHQLQLPHPLHSNLLPLLVLRCPPSMQRPLLQPTTWIGIGVGAGGLRRDPLFPHQMWNVLGRHEGMRRVQRGQLMLLDSLF